MDAYRIAMASYVQARSASAIRQKYHSLNNLDKSEKVKAMRDTSLNPDLMEDPRDAMANIHSRWAQQAPAFAQSDEATKQKVASDYFDKHVGPSYDRLGVPRISKEIWMRNAWKGALEWDTSQAYRNPVAKGILEGMDSVIAQTANLGRNLTNLAGLPIAAFMDSVRRGDYTGLTGFHNLAMNMHNRVKEEGLLTGAAKTIEETGERNFIGPRFMHDISSQAEYWHDVTPSSGLVESGTSLVTELAMTAPMFGALREASTTLLKGAGEAAKQVPILENLTKALSGTKKGKLVANMLLGGTEGLVTGAFTTDADKKEDVWKDALYFAAGNSIFSFRGKKGKLSEFLPDGDDTKKAMEQAEKDAFLATQGKRTMTRAEIEDAYTDHMASVMGAGGMVTAHGVVEDSLANLRNEERMLGDGTLPSNYRKAQYSEDPLRYGTVHSNMNVLNLWLEDRGLKMSSMTEANWRDFATHIHDLLDRAAAKVSSRVPALSDLQARELVINYMKTPEGQAQYKEFLQQAVAQGMKPEEAEQVAIQMITKNQKDIVEHSAAQKHELGPANVAEREIQSQRPPEAKNPPIDTARQRVNSHYEYDKSGRVTGYSMSISHDWNVAADKAAKSMGGTNNTQFWNDYVDTVFKNQDDYDAAAVDFAKDLQEHFDPLKKLGLLWETGKAPGGVKGDPGVKDYTNFLGYMYNLRNELPRPVADKLEEVLMNSPKMSEILGSRPSALKLREFSQAMHNHVDFFTRSKWYKEYGQRNIFRSSQKGATGKASLSRWQRDKALIQSAHDYDMKLSKEFYPGRSKAAIAARETYEGALFLLQQEEKAAYLSGEPTKVAKHANKIRKYIATHRAKGGK